MLDGMLKASSWIIAQEILQMICRRRHSRDWRRNEGVAGVIDVVTQEDKSQEEVVS
jgi:hypothetical protein